MSRSVLLVLLGLLLASAADAQFVPGGGSSGGGGAPSGPAGGDLSGTYPNPSVASVGGKALVLGGALTTSGTGAVTLAFPNLTATFTLPSASKTLSASDLSNVTLSGDCTNSSAAITCTKTNGSAFAASATTDTTNAGNISSGTLSPARGGTGVSNGTSTLTLGGNTSLPAAPASTQCLHMANTGAISATGSDCGSGGGTAQIVYGGSGSTVFGSPDLMAAIATIPATNPPNGQGIIVAKSGTVSNLFANMSSAPGGTNSRTLTLVKQSVPGGAVTQLALSCTLGSAATQCADTTHTDTVTAGQAMFLEVVCIGGSCATSNVAYGFELQ